MSCPSEARLAAAVAGDDLAAAAHADDCPRCAAIVADGRAIRAALAGLPRPARPRRADLLAEVLAEAERAAAATRPRASRRPWRIGAAAIAVAAMVTGAAAGVSAVRERVTARHAIAVEARRVAAAAPGPAPRVGAMPRSRPPVEVAPPVEVPPVEVPPVDVAPPVEVPPVETPLAEVAPAASSPGPQRVASSTESPAHTPPPPRVETPARVPPSPVDPVAPPVAPPAGPPVAPPIGVAAFRAGWEALRRGQPQVARAHFDRARDPAVTEDAMYWAAVASERAGELLDAARRYRSFAQAFPSSPRAAEARAAAARIYDR